MKRKIYQKYKSKLETSDIIGGIEKCFSNALFLFEEAKHCSEREKYSLGYYLLCTSEEEYIKSYLLLYHFTVVQSDGVENFWNYYRNHEPKRRLMLFKRHLENKDIKTYLENIYFLLNQGHYENIRQNSLYCDCVVPKKFICPYSTFVKDDIEEAIQRLNATYSNWGSLIKDKKVIKKILKLSEENPSQFISPDTAFRIIYGKSLYKRGQKERLKRQLKKAVNKNGKKAIKT